ncbi:putative flavin-containing polyamine oxidase [Xylona heveae TC161]|uniref:Amine oxidase n=1 Tax=Xylona heveae (strain CBS 132557 / TC161) TaxID=1328760 RepID=A0A165I7F7_XYLHT|nr:putative flavin-containing polyamine oxidase [Xylona heveae TC161]KZF24492.1 putative flavin-containing polyamine oxidase [Xylona heveae TC161]
MFLSGKVACLGLLATASLGTAASPPLARRNETCQKTSVAILGAGLTGITAAQALSNQSVSDFIILEYNGDIGGRVAHTTFGADKHGKPYVVELGANWVQGLGSEGGPENPIWTLAKKWNISNTYSNYSSIQTFNASGYADYSQLLDDFEDYYATFEQDAGYILTENLQDRSVRSGLSLAGWKPKKNMEAQAVEWWEFDWEYAYSPEQSSQEFAVVNYNTTFYQWSDANNFVVDQRGFNAFIKGEASEFLAKNDSRLRLNTIVKDITYSDSGVTIYNKDGSCVDADYAICTFSVGVLQNDVVEFDPPLPDWKKEAIDSFSMGTYTKLFLQFPPDKVFWNTSYQFLLYASPTTRGYYPVWQSLDLDGFIPDSGILFVTVVQDQSYRVESQDDEQTKEEVLAVLREMYGPENVPVPTSFMYPRWSKEPWAFGSYSNWPPGTTLEMHQNLRANLDRLYFAGEATSPEYFGFLQAAYYEGKNAGSLIASCVKGNCTGEKNYDVLHGTTKSSEYTMANGWSVSSFLTWGF